MPLLRMPGDYGLHTLSRLYVDGMPMEDLQALYAVNTEILGADEAWTAPNRFWATNARPAESRVREVMEVALNTEKWVNYFSFRVSHFPCRWWIQWYNEKRGEWIDCRERARPRKQYQRAINHSVPARIPEGVVTNRHRHPQHFGEGHWRGAEAEVRAVKAKRFRIVLVRMERGKVPRNRHGKKVDYSLAVQDFQLGMKVKHPRDVPRRPIRTQHDPSTDTFASSNDLLGSPVSYSLREYRASDILWPSRQAMNGLTRPNREHDEAVWKCEPQPLSYAVVNLYVDARDGDGEPQNVDRFWLDPLTPGVHCNLYYSNDTLSEKKESSDEPLRYPAHQAHGTLRVNQNGILFPTTEFGYLDVDNTVVQWRPQATWWLGMEIQPQFASDDVGEYVFLDSQACTIRWRDQTLEVVVNGITLSRSEISFVHNERLSLIVGYDTERVHAFMPGWSAQAEAEGAQPRTIDDKSLRKYLRFGGNLVAPNENPGHGAVRIRGMVLKREPITEETAGQFWEDPESFFLKPDLDEDHEDHTHNSRLRYHPYYQTSGGTSLNPYGLVGGPGLAYEDVEWTPINRDYRLHRGYMQFDPTKAKFFKFEFTNLTPEPYTPVEVLSRRVKLFSADTATEAQRHHKTLGGQKKPPGGAGNQVNQQEGALVAYSDMARLITRTNPNRGYAEYTPTEALYARDPNAAARLRKASPVYNFHPWHRTGWSPRFVRRQRHFYETVEVEHKDKVAYFVGLKGLRMFTTDYTSVNDNEQYIYNFEDRLGLDDENDQFPWVPNGEYAGIVAPKTMPVGYVQSTSKILNSKRNVRAVQFASQQTRARQLLYDPDFNDTALQTWVPYQGATIEASEDMATDIGTTIRVVRQNAGGFWDFLETRYDDWRSIEETDLDPFLPAWDDLQGEAESTSVGGVEGSHYVQPSNGGRLYAAARVYAPDDLHGPLHVQIITETGEVLTDQQVEVQAGRVAEWYAAYSIGEGGQIIAPSTWDEKEAQVATWDAAEAEGTWIDLDATQRTVTGPVTVRLYQDGPASDVFYVDNLALYEDAIVWEFSNDDGTNWWPVYDIRNNPHGVFTFPDLTPETAEQNEGTNLRWRVRSYRPDMSVTSLVIRPWYSSLGLGVPYKEALEHGGPNITPYDQYPAITDHAPFKAWSKPVPEDWYFVHRRWLYQQHLIERPAEKTVVPEAIVPGDRGRPPLLDRPYLSDALVVISVNSEGLAYGDGLYGLGPYGQ